MFITYCRVWVADDCGGFVEFWERRALNSFPDGYTYYQDHPEAVYRVWL